MQSIDEAGPDSADHSAHIENGESICPREQHPGKSDQNTSDQHEQAWAEAVGKICFEGHKPGLEKDKEGEGYLDGRFAPMVFASIGAMKIVQPY